MEGVTFHQVAGVKLPIIEHDGKQWIPLLELARSTGIKLARLRINCSRMHGAHTRLMNNGSMLLERQGLVALLSYMRTDSLTEPLKRAALELGGCVPAAKKGGRPRKTTAIEAQVKEALAAGQSLRSVAKKHGVARRTVGRIKNQA